MRYTLALIVAAALCCTLVVGQVNLPDGFEIVVAATSDEFAGPPSINDCGQIAIMLRLGPSWADAEIFLYDNGSRVRITDNHDRDVGVRINNAGTLTWRRGIGDKGVTQLIHLEDGKQTILDDNRKGLMGGSINNPGHVAWPRVRRRNCNTETDILLWDGQTARVVIPNDHWTNQASELNDFDHFAWMHTDFCPNPWVGDIRLYREGQTIVLPSGTTQPQAPTINNLGQVAWDAGDTLEIWENGETRVLTDLGILPALNNLGDLYFVRWGVPHFVQPWLCHDAGGDPVFYRLVDDQFSHTRGDVNDSREVAWQWFEDPPAGNFAGGIRFLRRIRTGDSEFDGDVDLEDYGAFADCMTGPGRVDRLCDCRFLDIDHDGDVDLGDCALFQNAFTGD